MASLLDIFLQSVEGFFKKDELFFRAVIRPSCLYWGLTFAIVFPWSFIGWSWPTSVVGMLSFRYRIPRADTFRRNLIFLESNFQCIFPPAARVGPSAFQSTVLLRIDTSRSLS